MSLLDLFKGRVKIKDAEKGIEEIHNAKKNIDLYCQSPYCRNPLINDGEQVAAVNGNLTHDNDDCIHGYGIHQSCKSGKVFISSRIVYMPYSTAQRLAKNGEVKFAQLEKIASVGGAKP